MADWEIWIGDTLGNRLALVDKFIEARATKIANYPGAFTLTMPANYDQYIREDAVIEVWRRPTGGMLKLFNAYMIRSWTYSEGDLADTTVVSGEDGISLLRSRVVAYPAGSTDASANGGACDDIMKRVVRFAMTTDAADADRSLAAYGFTVTGDLSQGAALTAGFSYRNVLDVLSDIAETSSQAGIDLYFDVVPTLSSAGGVGWEFRTAINQPGADRTGADSFIFGRDWGNLVNVMASYDYSREISVVYALGRGNDANRSIEEVEDTTRTTLSPWARREASYNVSGQASSTDAYIAAGRAELERNRPKIKLTGQVVDGPSGCFQCDWNWGDRVIINSRAGEFEAVVTAVEIGIDSGNRETINATFEVVQ